MDKCSLESKPKLIQVAPGVFIDPVLRTDLSGAKWMLLDERGYKQLGIDGFGARQRETMRRLFEGGFIRISMLSPRIWILDLGSWQQHVQRCADDPWHWDREGKNLNRYRATY